MSLAKQKDGEKVRWIFLLLLTALLAPVLHGASVPEVFNYQGRLLDEEGQPLGGAREAVFGVYDVPAGGTVLWEQRTTIQADTNGLFNVTLGGGTNSLLAAVGNRFGALYLDMTFKIGGVMEPVRPRPQFVSAAYARLAENIAGAQTLEVSSNLAVRQKAQLGVLNADKTFPDLLKASQITTPKVQEVATLSAYTGNAVRVESPAVFNGFNAKGLVLPPPSPGDIPFSPAFGGTWYQVTSDQWLSFSAVGGNGATYLFIKVSPNKPGKAPDQLTQADDPKLKIYQSSLSQYNERIGLCVPVPAGYWVGCYVLAFGETVTYNLDTFFNSVELRMIQGL
jgi:hypothetical protein